MHAFSQPLIASKMFGQSMAGLNIWTQPQTTNNLPAPHPPHPSLGALF